MQELQGRKEERSRLFNLQQSTTNTDAILS